MKSIVDRIISGGQTGVDRAGLDAAMEAGIPAGGYCPEGRLAEDGVIPAKYPLTELASGGYPARTEKNVAEADATLILNVGELSDGTRYTVDCALTYGKPCLVVQLDSDPEPDTVRRWLTEHSVRILNIAGPRETKYTGIYDMAYLFLRRLFP
ncbi:MAG: putative molybdenum carrier protein [Geobacteraceae bacterium]|nr:putative molybdenum carrier protein [Geobacteraceae bacterium]